MGIPLRNMRSQGRKDKGSNDEIIVNYQTVRREPFYPKRSQRSSAPNNKKPKVRKNRKGKDNMVQLRNYNNVIG